ncbi:MAG TPA: NADP-dependent malic enzyme [Steroidobacteraceae bacterium]|nr:NADP-dependent malic enzyme [Steroidobacteraceae bacterium]
MEEELKKAALDYHRLPTPGKISLTPTKALTNQRDLSLAYSPGVAYASLAIKEDPLQAASLTARANLVAVVTNGTAVLGLGNIGPLAGKPVMEGKGCLFKKFAGIDVFDLEIAENDPDRLVDIVAALEPTFGGINLEDIKAPECFYIERKLRERMKIPVFHDDQHGTAIIVAAAVLNGLRVVGKDIGKVKVAGSGAGAAAIACLDLLVALGLKKQNVTIADSSGVVYQGRPKTDADKLRYAQATNKRTLAEIVGEADIFLGLSGPGVLKAADVARMAPRPLILALANPEPEIRPELAREVRPDCIVCTGRSDYPNQVNNSLCFPFIFRGALDVGATVINEEMKLATVHALAELARAEQSDVCTAAYGESGAGFGPDFLIPRAFDPRLITTIAPAVAKAAMDSGVATRPIADLNAYRAGLTHYVYQSASAMRTVFASAQHRPKRLIYAEGEDPRVLQAAQVVVDEGLARPILVGRTELIAARIEKLGLRLKLGENCEGVNVLSDARFRDAWTEYYQLACRDGVTRALAMEEMRSRTTLIGAILVRRGDGDAMLCGTVGDYLDHLKYVRRVIGLRDGVSTVATMQMLILNDRQLFFCDTHVNRDPDAAQIAEMTLLAAEQVTRFGLTPRVALLSHSSFGSSDAPSARKMRAALALIGERAPELEVDGEMRADSALSSAIRENEFPNSRLRHDANLLIMPNVDAANVCYNSLRIAAGGGVIVGGILLGIAQPVHIMTPSSTVRRIVDMSAVAVADAGALGAGAGPRSARS